MARRMRRWWEMVSWVRLTRVRECGRSWRAVLIRRRWKLWRMGRNRMVVRVSQGMRQVHNTQMSRFEELRRARERMPSHEIRNSRMQSLCKMRINNSRQSHLSHTTQWSCQSIIGQQSQNWTCKRWILKPKIPQMIQWDWLKTLRTQLKTLPQSRTSRAKSRAYMWLAIQSFHQANRAPSIAHHGHQAKAQQESKEEHPAPATAQLQSRWARRRKQISC